ncbi:putative Mitochondrial carrier protein [Zostera marina]|uniref:Putative Mitochondrial carrier protein n=1 Tax=Zostera marina TaxID=29655 RepID=A0A0K9NI74_ZOSMR|nr:putative Mitochondrial carrier protein [Zostera marina]
MVISSQTPHVDVPSWMAASSRVEFDGGEVSATGFGVDSSSSSSTSGEKDGVSTDSNVGLLERSISAAGAAVISAILVNPLDVAKTRLQAQDAGIQYSSSYHHDIRSRIASFGGNRFYTGVRCYPSFCRGAVFGDEAMCTSNCFQYKGTLDVFNKVVRQEGLTRLWRGTNAGLALAIPTVGIYLPCYDIFRNGIEGFTTQNYPILTPYVPLVAGSLARSLACISCYPIELARTRMQAFKVLREVKPPGIWKTLLEILSPVRSGSNLQKMQGYRVLWTGVGAQLARDVPFSAICWATLEPLRRNVLELNGGKTNAASVLGANFASGFIAGTIAAAATCPLDVAKTRRQIEKDPSRALNMTTRQTLLEIVRDRGVRGLFTGIGPRVGRAGPSVGIVVSFYEVMKYGLNKRQSNE